MLVRDVDGKIVIVYRKDCKNEQSYNEKIYNIVKKYKSVAINSSKNVAKSPTHTIFSKNFTDD